MEIVHCAQRGSLSLELDSEHYTGILYRLASKYSQTFQQLSKFRRLQMCMTDRRLQGLGVQIKAFSKNVNTSNLYLITVVYFYSL